MDQTIINLWRAVYNYVSKIYVMSLKQIDQRIINLSSPGSQER